MLFSDIERAELEELNHMSTDDGIRRLTMMQQRIINEIGFTILRPPVLDDFKPDSDNEDDSPSCCDKCNEEEDLDDDWQVCEECVDCYCSTCEYKNGISVFALSGDDEIICYKCKIKKHTQTDCKLSIHHLELIKKIAAD